MPLMLANRCAVCSNMDVTVLGEKEGRAVGQCTQCGLIYTLSRALNYEALYTEGTRYHVDRDGHIPYRARYMHDLNVAVSRHHKLKEISKPRSLDVGCANGAFVEVLRDRGYRSEGLELNPGMAAWTSERIGVPIHTSWSTVAAPFDLITYHDVIEHVVDPAAELRRAYDYLLPGGLLILDTPDAGDPVFQADVMNNKHVKPLEHLWFFRQEDLQSLLVEAGFHRPEVDRPIPGKLVLYARRH